MSEIWLPVVGYETHYSVSNLGRIRRDQGGRGSTIGRILTSNVGTNDYFHVELSKNDVKQRFRVHRLVALAFLGPAPFADAVVNHIDGNKQNNRPVNLEWCSVAENNRHAQRTGLVRHVPLRGERNGRAVLTRAQVDEVRRLQGTVGQRSIARLLGVSKTLIQRIHQGKLWPEDLRVREFPEVSRG